jgi:hypothetical protein
MAGRCSGIVSACLTSVSSEASKNGNTGRSTNEATSCNASHSNEEEREDATPIGLSDVAKGKQKAVEMDDSTTDTPDIVGGALVKGGGMLYGALDDVIKVMNGEAKVQKSEVVAEASHWPTTRKPEMRSCSICGDFMRVWDLFQTVCNHDYCEGCLRSLFNYSFRDETLFPPRCCKVEIDLGQVAGFLTAESIAKYWEKKPEFESTNRTYCSYNRCGTFIRQENIDGDHGYCHKCTKETCVLCKAPSHDDVCSVDTETENIIEELKKEGAQRCIKCGHGVIMTYGCNRMT